MSLVAQKLHVRGFLEGIEIPIISCVVQMTINAPAAASINIVPLDEALEFKFRTKVHLFFYDYTQDEEVDLTDLSKYKLLFAGETIGVSFTKTPMGRTYVLQCTDFSSDWDLCYQYMVTWGPGGNAITEQSAVWAGGNSLFNDIVDGHAQVLARYLERQPKTPGLESTTGLLGGIISLIEALGGVPNHHVGVNDFFTISELMNHTTQQIVAEENDNTAQRLFESKEFYEWLEKGVTSLGELCTIRDMIMMLFKYIYYQVIPNTCAYYIPGDAQKQKTQTQLQSQRVNNQIQEIVGTLYDDKNAQSSVNRAKNALNLLDLLSSIQQIPDKQKKQIDKANSYLKSVVNSGASSSDAKRRQSNISSISKNLKSASDGVKKAIELLLEIPAKKIKADRLNTLIFRPECYFVAPPRCSVIFPEHVTQFSYDRNIAGEPTRLRLQSGMMFGISDEKLLAEYAYAPALKEIQELAKKTGTHGIRTLLPWEKFTGIRPKFEYVNEINYVANKTQKALQKNVVGAAVSYKQKAANFNFFKQRFANRSINVSLKFHPFIVCGFPALIIDRPFIIDRDLISQIAKAQNINITGPITADSIIANIQNLSTSLAAPTHYLGMVQSITHSVSSESGGNTIVAMSHARTHKVTEDDFLVSFQAKKTTEAGVVTVSTYLDSEDLSRKGDAKNLQFLIDATPQDSNANKSKNVKTTKIAERPKLKVSGLDVVVPALKAKNKTDDLTQFTGETQTVETNNATILVPSKYGKLQIGSKGPKGGKITQIQLLSDSIVKIPINLGALKNAKLKSTDEKLAWRTAVIYEEVKSSSQLKPIPIEHALLPNWFSPLYSNLYIGDKIYTPFFGTGSLVDQTVFSSPEGLSVQAVGANRQQLLDKLSTSTDLTNDVQRLTQTDLFNMPDVETAANILAFQYGEIRRLGLDVNKFVNDYVHRPIATITDIFGSLDLQYKKTGTKLEVAAGTPGFHSAAIADFGGNLLGLVDNPDLEYPRLNEKGKFKISGLLDPRPERLEQVKKYVTKLEGLGGDVIGLQG